MAERRPDRWLGSEPHRTFWNWCSQGELRLQRCSGCGNLAWPAVDSCEYCGGENFFCDRMSGNGTVVAWTTFERDYYAGMLAIPWDTILVELAEGPLFLSNPRDFSRTEILIGMPVKLAFIDCEDSAGPFSLPVFERT